VPPAFDRRITPIPPGVLAWIDEIARRARAEWDAACAMPMHVLEPPGQRLVQSITDPGRLLGPGE
jgi:hypothetical protein